MGRYNSARRTREKSGGLGSASALAMGDVIVPEMRPSDINALCSERGWSRSHFIRELRSAASARGIELRGDDSLDRMIRQWNSGTRGLSRSNADLLSDVFGVRFTVGRPATSVPDVTRRSVLSASAIIAASARQSTTLIERLASTVDPLAIDQLAADTERLAVEYIGRPPAIIADEAKQLRDSVMVTLERTRRPSQIRDLYLLSGKLGGILAYAAMDLGDAAAAMANARSSLLCADLAGSSQLIAWVRGTQSLIARFASRYQEAEKYLQASMNPNPQGINLARLASGLAQCRAHAGDTRGTFAALKAAFEAHSNSEPGADDIGVFGFPRSKVHYYAASSLIWLPDNAGSGSATTEAATAITLFKQSPPEERFITDEVLAHIYGATAHIQRGEVDGAATILKPIFDTPTEQRVSWHRKRLARLTSLLSEPQFRKARQAVDLQARLKAF
jgi:hypothetical protein